LLDLKEKVSRKGLSDQISFLGYVDDNDRPGILQSWTLAVIPSSYEPFGIVALELAQVGIPIIAAQVGGLADIISSPKFGYPIPEVSGDTIAREIELILSNPEQAGERATRLRERVAIEFTWERVVDLTDLIYEKIRS
jgi:glycosyltransferase involved in cell wall biosynthesis